MDSRFQTEDNFASHKVRDVRGDDEFSLGHGEWEGLGGHLSGIGWHFPENRSVKPCSAEERCERELLIL